MTTPQRSPEQRSPAIIVIVAIGMLLTACGVTFFFVIAKGWLAWLL